MYPFFQDDDLQSALLTKEFHQRFSLGRFRRQGEKSLMLLLVVYTIACIGSINRKRLRVKPH